MKILATLIIAISITSGLALAQPSLTSTPKVALYAKPNAKSKIVGRVKPWHHLVPIYAQGEWIEVGDPSNGMVGWINKKSYLRAIHQMRQAWIKRQQAAYSAQTSGLPQATKKSAMSYPKKTTADNDTKSSSITVTRQGNKPPKIVAYRNGKKLSQKESKRLLQRLQQQQHGDLQHDLRMQQKMQRMFQQTFNQFDRMEASMANTMGTPPVVYQNKGQSPIASPTDIYR